jgi:hypothetical protein
MNYIPVVAWGLYPGGTDKQVANYTASWGLFGDAPEPTFVEVVSSLVRKMFYWY